VYEWTAIPIGQMQVETGAGLKADGEQTEAAARGEWRCEVWLEMEDDEPFAA